MNIDASHHDEVQTMTIFRGGPHPGHVHDENCNHGRELIPSSTADYAASDPVNETALKAALDGMPKESVWRVKGFLILGTGSYILNWAFGRYELTKMTKEVDKHGINTPVKLTLMGERGEVNRHARKLAVALSADVA